MRYDEWRHGDSVKCKQETLVPIETLLLKQSKGEFLSYKEKVRVKEYEAEQRKNKKNQGKRK